jgi:cardiolipin synthase
VIGKYANRFPRTEQSKSSKFLRFTPADLRPKIGAGRKKVACVTLWVLWFLLVLGKDERDEKDKGYSAMEWWQSLEVEITAILSMVLLVVTIPWILLTKRDSTSAVAWCLLVFFVPIFGSIFFVLFGYQHIHRRLKRKRKHKKLFGLAHAGPPGDSADMRDADQPDAVWHGMSTLAMRFGAFSVSRGNTVCFYHEGTPAQQAIREAIASARHHIHLEYFIFQPDETGRAMLDLLCEKAKQGVQVRLLYDAMGSRRLRGRTLMSLRDAGGKCREFLPLNPLRRRIQVNMRDHRKILVVDGRVAFTGGLNIGDEYLGRVPRFGFWRDTHLRVEGPGVADLQRVFVEGWDFAAEEDLRGPEYFPPPMTSQLRGGEGERKRGGEEQIRPIAPSPSGPLSDSGSPLPNCMLQVIPSGPDMEMKSIREVYFAAVLRARRRLWIASPYFVPDAGLLDALCLAGYLGVDVRLLCQHHPDKWIPFFAGRYYWSDVLAAGVKVYQYTKGMMHSKVVLVDGEWVSVGTANMDNRSLHLNFEVNCLIYSAAAVAELEAAFCRDLTDSILLDPRVYDRRPLPGRLVENASRLLSPVL